MDDPDSNSQILENTQTQPVDEDALIERLCELFEEGEESDLNAELGDISIENLCKIILTPFLEGSKLLYKI